MKPWPDDIVARVRHRYDLGERIVDIALRLNISPNSIHVYVHRQGWTREKPRKCNPFWTPKQRKAVTENRAKAMDLKADGMRLYHAKLRAANINVDHSQDAEAIDAFIAAHGVTRCPTVAVAETQAICGDGFYRIAQPTYRRPRAAA